MLRTRRALRLIGTVGAVGWATVAHAQDAAAPTTPPPAETAPAPTPPTAATPPPTPPPPVAPPRATAPPAPARPAPYPYPYPYGAYPYYPYPYPYAYPPRPPATSAPPTSAPEAIVASPAAPTSMRAPADDPQADRGVLLPTAYTHPRGTFFFSSYDLLIEQIGYAFTDDTQISLTGLPPVGADDVAVADVTLKTSLYRGPRLRVAALGSASGFGSKSAGVFGIGRFGGVAQMCLESRCDSSLTMSSNVALAGALVMVNGVSGVFRLGRVTSLLAEVDTLLPFSNDIPDEIGGAMAGGGIRLRGESWGFDFALMRVIGGSRATLPLLALTYRTPP
ncbi:MAG TPA: hypothetical protein VHJ20_01455 [Polyangia bacterium]|nr:hypothetical protein [Polyangia bacterium]